MSCNMSKAMLHQYPTFKLEKEMFVLDVSQAREFWM